MVGAHQNLNGSRDPITGCFVICGLALAMVNLCTKFEVSISTHYKDTNSNTKWQYKISKMRWFGVVMGHSKSL